MKAEQAFQQRAPLIFVVDQKPFQNQAGHRFCILYPLMTLEGEHLKPDAEHFPLRGRLWWKLRDDIRDEIVVPGSIWTGKIEQAFRAPRERQDADLFQARVHEIFQGGEDLVEILPVLPRDPELSWLQEEIPLPWPKPTTARVILWGMNYMLGPLTARWNASTKSLTLSALSAGQPEVLRVPVRKFFEISRIERFDVTLNEYEYTAEAQKIPITVSRLPWLKLDRLREAGEVVDASTDAQVVNWAVQYLGWSGARSAPMKELLADLAAHQDLGGEAHTARKRVRFQQIAQNAERVLGLGEEVGRTLMETPAFASLVEKHVETLAGKRVEAAIAQRQEEIQTAIQTSERTLQQVKADLDNLAAEYDRKTAAAEAELSQRLAERVQAIEDRDRQVGRREQHINQLETRMMAKLEGVIARYQKEADHLGDDLLLQLPLLRRFGPSSSGGESAPALAAFADLRTPDFLDQDKNHQGPPLAEADFINQFLQVVEQKGFLFVPEDLINFHVCVKIGGLTVLAGPSGTGKTSLPRLYAEALECREEFLHVPVRPDWLDDRDLVGSFNGLAQRFEPSNSGLVEHLVSAALDQQKKRGGIYLICLDEMNLARVEHYFAQFLSVLELPPEHRHLTLFAPGLVKAGDPYGPYQRLPLGDNLRFVGTVNIDETTHFFSPKMLDRCQVVALAVPDVAGGKRSSKEGKLHGLQPVPLSTYLSWMQSPQEGGAARAFLGRINELLRPSRLGLGFRQFDRILRYVASAQPFFSEDVALDYQLKQVVCPRLRSTAPLFAQTIQELARVVLPDRFPRSADLLGRLLEAKAEDDYFQLI